VPRQAQAPSRHWTLVTGALMLVIELLFVAGLVSPDWARAVRATEALSRRQDLGARAEWVEDMARGWFEGAFVATGLVAASYAFLLPDAAERRDAHGLEPLGEGPLFGFVRGRLEVAWGMLALALERLAWLLAWGPLAGLATAAALADAGLRRRRREAGFTPPQALRHRLAAEGLRVLAWGVLYGLFLPWPWPAASALVVLALAAALTGALTAHR